MNDCFDLREIYLLAGLSDDQLETVAKTMRAVSLEEGQRLFDFRQPARHFYFLRAGQVKLFRNSPDGGEKVIWLVEPRETFAEAVMFMEKHVYPVSAEAIEPSEVLAFETKVMMEILRASVDTCFRLMAGMSTRLRQQVNEIHKLTLHNATFRLVSYLLDHVPAGVMESPELQLCTPKHVIASRLSIQPETFSRILSRLTGKALIEVHGQSIVLRDIQGLRSMVDW